MPFIRETPEFVSYFALTPRQGEIASVSVFEEQRGAEESNKKAEERVRQNPSDLRPSSISGVRRRKSPCVRV